MNLKVGDFEFNKYALAITCFFVLFVVMRTINFFSISGQFVGEPLPATTLLGDLVWMPLIFEAIVAGIAGLKASHLFGGRRNFTGKLLFYFSLQIFFYMAFVTYFELQALKILTPSFFLDVLFANSGFAFWIAGLMFCFPAYALWAGVRSTWSKFDSKFLMAVSLSFALALMVGAVNLLWGDPTAGQTTVADTVLWVGIVPTMTFLELSSGILLLRSLGKWYVKKSITALVLAVLFNVTMIAIVSSVGFYWFAVAYNPNFASYFWGDLLGNCANFLICLAITQFRIRMTGPFF
jgi:hypothetical protein